MSAARSRSFGRRRPAALALWALSVALPFAPRAALAEGSRGTGGAVGTRVGWPCPGCVMVVPPSYSPDTPTPLFVALHGDEGSTRVVLKLWKASVEKRGYLLLALLCPKEKGCAGSYWRWAGEPSFMEPALDAVEAAYNVERSRVYLSGWSGGSTYMGMMAPSLSPRFAALNLNAGGIPPEAARTCAPCKAPVYYFMGGKNPYAHYAEDTRDYYRRCGHDVEWDFAKDLDHPGELLALSKVTRQEKILAWFDDKRSQCVAGAGAGAASADAGAPPPDAAGPEVPAAAPGELNGTTSVPGAASGASSSAGPSEPRSAATVSGCGCRGASTSGADPRSGAALLIAAALIGARWRRRA